MPTTPKIANDLKEVHQKVAEEKKNEVLKKEAAPQANESENMAVKAASENRPIDTAQLNVLWQQFKADLRTEGREFLAQVMDAPKKLQGAEILLELVNPFLEPHFNELKPRLAAFLRQNTGHPEIEVSYLMVKPKATVNRLYTDHDKLSYLIEKFPMLEELRNQLGLDTA